VFTDLFGYTRAEIPAGTEWFKLAFPDPEYRKEAISTWISDRKQAGIEPVRSRIFRVHCRNGEEKNIRFCPVASSEGNRYIACEEVAAGGSILPSLTPGA